MVVAQRIQRGGALCQSGRFFVELSALDGLHSRPGVVPSAAKLREIVDQRNAIGRKRLLVPATFDYGICGLEFVLARMNSLRCPSLSHFSKLCPQSS